MLWHQSCTKVMPLVIASAAASRVPWYMSVGSYFCPSAGGSPKVPEVGLVAGHAAKQAVPHVPVRFDETGKYDHASGVDRSGSRHIELLPHGDDHAVLDVHVAVFDIACACFHRHDVGVADDGVGSRRQAGCNRGRGECRRGRAFQRGKRSTALENAAAIELQLPNIIEGLRMPAA